MILDSDAFVAQIESLRDDSDIKGVLLVVDSPGGALSPSVEIYEELRKLAAQKPLVAYAQGTLASGSYYAALPAEQIIANKGALIGSIGVIFEGLDVSELMAKLGIKPQVLKAGDYKETGTMLREWEDHEKKELQELLTQQYEMFVSDVCMERSLDCSKKQDFAEGRVFDSRRALNLGLIDKIGTKNDAKDELVARTGVEHAIWAEVDSANLLFSHLQYSIRTLITILFHTHGLGMK